MRFSFRIAMLSWCLFFTAVLMLLTSTAFGETADSPHDPIGLLCNGDTVHLLCRKSCFEIQPDGSAQPCGRGCASISIMRTFCFPDHHSLALATDGRMYRWKSEGDTCWEFVAALKLPTIIERDRCTATDDALYITHMDEDQNWQVTVYPFSGAEPQVLCSLTDAHVLPYAGESGTLAVYLMESKRVVSIGSTGQITTLLIPENTSQYNAIASDGQGGVLVLSDRRIYRLFSDGHMDELNYTRPYSWSDKQGQIVTMNNGQHAVFVVGDTWQVISLTEVSSDMLLFAGYTSWLIGAVDYSAFEAEHPDIMVARQEQRGFDELANQLVTHSDGFDMMVLISRDDSLKSIKSKQAYVDLSGIPEIENDIAGLQPMLRAEVTASDGSIAALPLGLISYTMGYRPAVWEEAGITHVPQTWEQLLDMIDEWYDKGILDEYPLFRAGEDSFDVLLYALLRANAAHCEWKGELPFYSNERLMPLLKRLDEMRTMLRRCDARNLTAQPLLTNRFDACDLGAQYAVAHLPLGFDTADDYADLTELTTIVINPSSEHIDMAKQLLASIAQALSPVQRLQLMTDEYTNGIKDAENEAALAAYQMELEETLLKLEKAKQESNHQMEIYWQTNADALKEIINFMESTVWRVSPERASAYHEEIKHLALFRANGYSMVCNNADNILQAFSQGKCDVGTLVSKLDEIVGMWLRENDLEK